MNPHVTGADAAFRAGLHASAARQARLALREEPGSQQIRLLLAASLLGIGQFEEACDLLGPLADERPNDPAVLFNLASALRGLSRFDDAHEAIDKALSGRPHDSQLIAMKARLLIGQHRLEEASGLVSEALARRSGDPFLALEFAKVAPLADRHDEALSALADAKSQAAMAAPAVMHAINFATAKLLDSAGRHEEAFQACVQANKSRNMPWDASRHTTRIDQMIGAWSSDTFERLQKADVASPQIYVVGMPRSATTLVEQILSMHPDVSASGEQMIIPRVVKNLANTPRGLLPLLIDPSRLGAGQIQDAASEVAAHFGGLVDTQRFVTDKFPQNMLHLGAIALLTPGAKIVHCRRDPLDTGLSCFFQNFLGTMPYMYDLEHIGRFYADYLRLMDHWRDVLDLQIHEFDYKQVIADQEGETRRLLEFLGLDWEPACLQFERSRHSVVTASDVQVSQALYASSLGRWSAYAQHLEPLARPLRHLLTDQQREAIGI